MKDNYLPYYKKNIRSDIKKFYIEKKGLSFDFLANSVVRDLKNKYITENDEKLLNLVFQKDISQKDFDSFIKEWDIEVEGAHKALMLSYFMKLHPELNYPEYIEHRLKDLLQLFRFRKLKLIKHFKKVCTKLKEENIDILIIKGGAICHYFPEFPRLMGDIDILVHEDDYETCKTIIKEMGYGYKDGQHSIDLQEEYSDNGILDIHREIVMSMSDDESVEELINKDFFMRAKKEKVFGVENILVPCVEDEMFILLNSLIKNLIYNTSIPIVLYIIYDCMSLTKRQDFDWNVVRQNAIKTKTEDLIYIAIRFVNEFIPEKLPEFFENEFIENILLYLYNKKFIENYNKKSHSFSIIELLGQKINSIGSELLKTKNNKDKL